MFIDVSLHILFGKIAHLRSQKVSIINRFIIHKNSSIIDEIYIKSVIILLFVQKDQIIL
jgi:hypothetical protein